MPARDTTSGEDSEAEADPGEEERRTGAGAAKWKSVRENQQLKANINAQRKLKERQKKGVAPGLESMKSTTDRDRQAGKLKAFLGDYEFSADTAVMQRQQGAAEERHPAAADADGF